MSTSKKILFSVGELSADEHAAQLVGALRAIDSSIQFKAMGGSQLRAQGVEIVVDSETHGSIMGFHEVLLAANKVIASWRAMRKTLSDWRPDILILIDYPDFNLRLAAAAKKLGVKVFYFITPQVWAWRSGRVRTINRIVDRAAVILPFEKPFFESHGFTRSHFVGHPFVEKLKIDRNSAEHLNARADFFAAHGLAQNRPTLAVFPGSRAGEIKRHAPLLSPALKQFSAKFPQVQIVMPLAPSVRENARSVFADFGAEIKLLDGQALDVLRFADAGLLKSGTSNVQAAFLDLPFSVFYNASRLSEFLARRLVHLDCVSLVNIVRPKTVRELLQSDATPQSLALEMEQLLFDLPRRLEIQNGLREVVRELSSHEDNPAFVNCHSAYARVARLVDDLLIER